MAEWRFRTGSRLPSPRNGSADVACVQTASSEHAEGSSRKRRDPADDDWGSSADSVSDRPEDRTANRSGANKENGLDSEHPPGHVGLGTDLSDGGRRRHVCDAGSSNRGRHHEGQRDVGDSGQDTHGRPEARGAEDDGPDAHTGTPGNEKRPDQAASAESRVDKGVGAIATVQSFLHEDGKDNGESCS